ncbi:hypothetical protein U27_06331 [Candidatus Vecturithrix granuli]|uniref:Uncharacterized protein n=1 Tax=Vecturithrix granuli TaxID=1499967 RepID=A0A081C442_VECG1|nr:hypothetical protein U27_06331 [Candidatus Vecturithrix granuli]
MSFKPFQGLFRVSTGEKMTDQEKIATCFKPFQGLFRVSTTSSIVNLSKRVWVSNPSRDYSAFLRIVIPYDQIEIWVVSNPSRDYSAFLHLFLRLWRWFSRNSFKPFQGLFRVSTAVCQGYAKMVEAVSNPSRDYSAFLLLGIEHDMATQDRFKPFQGLFRVSTIHNILLTTIINSFQTLPGIIPRFYDCMVSSFIRLVIQFQTLPGIIPRFYKNSCLEASNQAGFQTLPGIIPRFYARTTDETHLWTVFQTLPGIIPRFYRRRTS